MTSERLVLEVEHLAKSYGRHQVLRDVTFGIGPGQITGITGENGSGKSTLLEVIVGRRKPDAGRIVHSLRFGYCPQELLIFESLTVEENLRYFATAYGLPRRDLAWREAAQSLLERFRCSQYVRIPVNQLSGGTKQKLNLIVAFIHSPDLLILDEPYAGFDWETYLQFWEYAHELRSEGKSVLIVAHLIFDSAQLDSVYRLTRGVLECA
ncbi:MAG TPA: ABC transporter ATP-binding protein [Acidobacteriota bacterium]|nr:ABC transporter ATP-binding protein [Acidobacteriota bacterium]